MAQVGEGQLALGTASLLDPLPCPTPQKTASEGRPPGVPGHLTPGGTLGELGWCCML